MSGDAMLVETQLSWGNAIVADAFLAARSGGDGQWLQVADVIFDGGAAGCAHGGSAAWLRATIDRYPGCAVVAAVNAGGCAVLARGGAVEKFRICGYRPCVVLAAAALVHCWLTAGWLCDALLLPARLTVATQEPGLSRWQLRGQAGGSPLSLVISAGPALSASSWRRTGTTSGAPSSS